MQRIFYPSSKKLRYLLERIYREVVLPDFQYNVPPARENQSATTP